MVPFLFTTTSGIRSGAAGMMPRMDWMKSVRMVSRCAPSFISSRQYAQRSKSHGRKVLVIVGAHNKERSDATSCRPLFTNATAPSAAESSIDKPSTTQLRRLFVQAGVPMIGFGFIDNVVMITMGEMVDSTLGVTFGLSTLTAAGIGQIFSDVSGVCFGGTVEAFMGKLGVPTASISAEQARMPITKLISTLGAVCGVITGCLLGMCTLLFQDTEGTEEAKHQAELKKMLEAADKTQLAEYVTKLKTELKQAEEVLWESEKTIAHLGSLAQRREDKHLAVETLTKIRTRASMLDGEQAPRVPSTK